MDENEKNNDVAATTVLNTPKYDMINQGHNRMECVCKSWLDNV